MVDGLARSLAVDLGLILFSFVDLEGDTKSKNFLQDSENHLFLSSTYSQIDKLMRLLKSHSTD